MPSSRNYLLSLVSLCSLQFAGASSLYAGDVNASAVLRPQQLITIRSPVPGEMVNSATAALLFNLSHHSDFTSLQATVNGKDITNLLRRTGSCDAQGCLHSVSITATDGLQVGQNSIKIRVNGKGTRNGDSARMNFDWTAGSTNQPGFSPYLPPTVGLTTLNPGGGDSNDKNWVQIYSNAAGSGKPPTYPGPNDSVCTVLQVLDLDRKSLAFKSFTCYSDGTSFYDALKQFDATDLIIAGTSFGANAPAGLNTTPIGGTDYSNYSSRLHPQGYMIVGSGGAPAGQAYESFPNFNTLYSVTGRYDFAAANGLLTRDGFTQYNFHPSDYVEYKVPLDASIIIGNAKYTMPDPDASLGGFWVLLIDRISLKSSSACEGHMEGEFMVYAKCGAIFKTGTQTLLGDSGALFAFAQLATALTNLNPQCFVFVKAYGRPMSLNISSPGLMTAINALGGAGYTMQTVLDASYGGSSPTFALISSSDPAFTKSLTGKSVLSTDRYNNNQNQSGYVHGVMTRNQKGLFEPVVSAQETGDNIQQNLTMDYSFYSIAWAQPGPWPYMDTTSEMAAYRYLSFAILQRTLSLSKNSTHLEDIRYDYTGSQNATVAANFAAANTIAMPSMTNGCVTDPAEIFQGVDKANAETLCFSLQDFQQVQSQIYKELKSLNQSIQFFGNAAAGTGLGGEVVGASGMTASMFDAITKVYTSVGSNSVPIDISPADQFNLMAGVAAIPGVFCPPLGVLSGVLWTASAVESLSADSTATTDIQWWFTGYLADYKNLTQSSIKYVQKIKDGYDTVLDNFYSDWNKLSAVSQKVVDGGSWYQNDQLKDLASFISYTSTAASRNAYLQLLPEYYSLDYWPAQTHSDPRDIASNYSISYVSPLGVPYTSYVCTTPYPGSVTAISNIAYARPSAGDPSRFDISVIGGVVTNNHSQHMHEAFPSADLTTTLFDPKALNLPLDLFFAQNGPLQRRDGPDYGAGTCDAPKNK